MDTIRNFSIIAHIDHGKSTLADRMLEVTGTIQKREMREQVLDTMDLERERGITIKMAPVRMQFGEYTLNLIDTPGHIDFAYEVSRALKAVEGVILLVDATQGVQAQTLSVLSLAQTQGLVIIPVLSKIDSPRARVEEVKGEVAQLIDCSVEDVLTVSGKTGKGVEHLLEKIIQTVPPPEIITQSDSSTHVPHSSAFVPHELALQALVFDFTYSSHRGIILHARVVQGEVTARKHLTLKAAQESFIAAEVGVFSPDEKPQEQLSAGEIGYIVTGIKKPGVVSVGDTVIEKGSNTEALSGYRTPSPVVWASVYPESQDDFEELRQSLDRLRLSDASLSFEEESSGVLGRGFRCGFLGMLHLEIVSERLKREFNLPLIITTPSVTYEVVLENGNTKTVYSPIHFPEHGTVKEVREPWVEAVLITPNEYMSPLMQLLFEHEAHMGESEVLSGDRVSMKVSLPLRELMRGFFDKLKSASSGYASLSYALSESKTADVVRLDVLVAEELVPAFSRVIARSKVQEEAEKAVERLYETLPRQQFVTKIQGKALGRILSSKTLKALRKDVTAKLYGGDVTRKKKLLEKQKKGKKKRQQAGGKVNIPQEVFVKMLKN